MREFIITVNSTVDLPKEWLEERHVPVLPLKYTIDGETYTDMSGLTAKEYANRGGRTGGGLSGSKDYRDRYTLRLPGRGLAFVLCS